MNALDELKNKLRAGGGRSLTALELAVLFAREITVAEHERAAAELAALRARVGELEQERDELLKSDSENCDEFNAGFDAYKAGLDLDNSEEFYRACKREEGIPSYDSFSTGYVWAKFTTERAALAKGAK